MNFKEQQKRESGFTLIEIVIVIAIIAILVAIAIPLYGNWRESAHGAVMKSDLHAAAKQMEIAKVEASEYPESLPASFRSSEGYTVEIGRQLNIPFLTAARNVYAGVKPTTTSEPYGPEGQVLKVTPLIKNNAELHLRLECPKTKARQSGTNALIACDFGGTGTTRTVEFAFSSLTLVCQAQSGAIYQGTTTARLPITPTLPRPADYVAGTPAVFESPVLVSPSQVCRNSAASLYRDATLVGVGATTNDATRTGLASVPLKMAYGTVLSGGGADSDYCLEATSTKTQQTWSYYKVGGMKEGLCT